MNTLIAPKEDTVFNFDRFIENALAEDIGTGDYTTLACVPEQAQGKAQLLVKEHGILSGIEISEAIFKKVDSSLVFTPLIADGSEISPGDIAFTVVGRSQSILTSERLVLNLLQRMSGIATKTNRIVKSIKNTNTKILDTRKTTPGLRALEKKAVEHGGGINHRFGLYDMIMIKDNHIEFCGGIKEAIYKTTNYLEKNNLNLKVEIEARTREEVTTVIEHGGIDRILLDNFEPKELKELVSLIDKRFETEASGGITEQTVQLYAETGVDYISIGELTHSVKSLDLSLKAV